MLSLLSIQAQEVENENLQTEKRDLGKNDLSIGALNLVAFGAIDLSYERILTARSGFATEVFIKALNRDNEDVAEAYERDFSLTGKYKYYFGDNYARGFYVHGLGMLSSGEYRVNEFYDNGGNYIYEDQKYTDFALGFGVGGKFVSSGGFFLDLSTGIGRNLFNDDSPTIVGQFNVNLGFRF